ncbi:MAG: hypothetical protein LEGION0398_MBIBDBAK_01149 [Legionellaceae bacterium]
MPLKITPILLGFLCLAFTIWLQISDVKAVKLWVTQLNNFAYDMQLRTSLHEANIDGNLPIAIVDIDDKSLKEQGRWPWSRKKMAQLVTELFQKGATIIALDLIFPESENNIATEVISHLKKIPHFSPSLIKNMISLENVFNHDQLFAQSLELGDSVLGITFLNNEQAEQGSLPQALLTLNSSSAQRLNILESRNYLGNLPLLQKAAKSGGFINAFPDEDGIIRHAQLIIRNKNNVYPSLSLEAARLYLLSQSTDLIIVKKRKYQALEGIRFDQQTIPTDAKGQILIPFRGMQGSFPYLSATDIINKKINESEIKDKIIFIGTSAVGLGDLHATAVQNIYPGVEIHASVAAGVLQNHFPYHPAWAPGAEFITLIFIGLVLGIIFPYQGLGKLLLTAIMTSILLFRIDGLLWEKYGIVLSASLPLLLIIFQAIANIAYGYLIEGRRRELLKSMFGQYVPSAHVDQMLKQKGDYGFSGETRKMTILFADIRNFTTISEKLDAVQLKNMLNQFFTPMTQIIFQRNGTIDKYVGDMIMAFWGAPIEDDKHATHAIEAAMDMQAAVIRLREQFINQYNVELKIGIGINTGEVNVGDMGSEFRRSYTVLGDNVNLASRLEGLSKFYQVGIIVGENTYNDCRYDFVFKPLDKVKVKGKDIAVNVFEPISIREACTQEIKKELSRYEEGLHFYYAQEWDKAEQIMMELRYQYPQCYVYTLYLMRINELRNNPPKEAWNGVYISKTK